MRSMTRRSGIAGIVSPLCFQTFLWHADCHFDRDFTGLGSNFAGFLRLTFFVNLIRERGWRVTRLDQYGRPKDPTAPIIELPTLPFPSDRYTVSMDFVLHPESFRGRPDVVAVVETLRERAARKGSKLKIAEIPDDIDRHIAENAGVEWVAEAHRV